MPTIAILGASTDRNKFGNKAVRAFLRQGYTVYPVNPKETVIENLPVSKTLAEVPVRELEAQLQSIAPGLPVHVVGGADNAAELDARRAIEQASRLALEI